MTSDVSSLGVPFRFLEEVGYIVPWFGIAWLAYDWGVKNNAYRKTKAGMIEYGEVTLPHRIVSLKTPEARA